MIKLRDILIEIGEGTAKPFKWEYYDEEEGTFNYYFKDDKAQQYVVDISPMDSGYYDVSFQLDGGEYKDITGSGVYRVMATVMQITWDFIDIRFLKAQEDAIEYTDEGLRGIVYTPIKTKGDRDQRREKLYRKYIDKAFPGSKITTSPTLAGDTYRITLPSRLQYPPTESNPYKDY